MVDEPKNRNPYAPPGAEAEESLDREAVEGPSVDFERERRSVFLCIVLTVFTAGLYGGLWLLRRRPFLNSLNAPSKLGQMWPTLIVVLSVASLVLPFTGNEARDVSRLVSLAIGLLTLLANFRVAAILRFEFARSGRFLDVSSLWTFFLGLYYLQYKINQGADTPARTGKKKKRKKPTDIAEAPPGPEQEAS